MPNSWYRYYRTLFYKLCNLETLLPLNFVCYKFRNLYFLLIPCPRVTENSDPQMKKSVKVVFYLVVMDKKKPEWFTNIGPWLGDIVDSGIGLSCRPRNRTRALNDVIVRKWIKVKTMKKYFIPCRESYMGEDATNGLSKLDTDWYLEAVIGGGGEGRGDKSANW
jgi:hypothetical protein